MRSIIYICLIFILFSACNTDIYDSNGIRTNLFKITQIDTTIKSYSCNCSSKFDLDIDGDNKDDFSLITEEGHSQGGADWYSSKLRIQNPAILFPLVDLIDSAMLCQYFILNDQDTVVSRIYYNTLSGEEYINADLYNLRRIDTILSVQSHQDIDSIMLADYHLHDDNRDVILASSASEYSNIVSSDLVYRGNIQNRYRLEMQNNQTFYIYFTIPKRSKVKFGWIKMSINDYRIIHVMEYAIEK